MSPAPEIASIEPRPAAASDTPSKPAELAAENDHSSAEPAIAASVPTATETATNTGLPALTMKTEADQLPASIATVASTSRAEPLQACFNIGPIASEPKARQLMTNLQGQTTVQSIYNKSVAFNRAYYVLAEQVPTITATRDLSARIRQAGISDSAIIRSGVNNGRLSLGVFSKHQSAIRRQQAMAEKGFVTEIAPLLGEKQQYWLHVTLTEKINSQDQLQQINASLPASASLEPLVCSQQVAHR